MGEGSSEESTCGVAGKLRSAPLAQLKVGCIFILTQPIPSRLWLRYYTAFLLIFFLIILCDFILIHAVAASN